MPTSEIHATQRITDLAASDGDGDDLFSLDVLPAHCTLALELERGEGGVVVRMRFRATRSRRFRSDETSAWSEWFDHTGVPVALRWETFGLKAPR